MEISINGEKYPCRPTMGAILRFKQETGKEVSEITGISDWIIYLYCCIASATKSDTGKDFPLPLMDFADSVPQELISKWVGAFRENTGEAAGAEKKSPLP